jgi:hypothetical protein
MKPKKAQSTDEIIKWIIYIAIIVATSIGIYSLFNFFK